jgi:hypothetical protein
MGQLSCCWLPSYIDRHADGSHAAVLRDLSCSLWASPYWEESQTAGHRTGVAGSCMLFCGLMSQCSIDQEEDGQPLIRISLVC